MRIRTTFTSSSSLKLFELISKVGFKISTGYQSTLRRRLVLSTQHRHPQRRQKGARRQCDFRPSSMRVACKLSSMSKASCRDFTSLQSLSFVPQDSECVVPAGSRMSSLTRPNPSFRPSSVVAFTADKRRQRARWPWSCAWALSAENRCPPNHCT